MTAEKQRERLARLREEHRCAVCGKPLDRKGSRCTDCLMKQRVYWKNRRDDLKARHVCVICGKSKVGPDEATCPECRAKQTNIKMRYRAKADNRLAYNAYMRKNRKNKVKNRLKEGLCTRCGKPNPDKRYHQCPQCRTKEQNRKRQYMNPLPIGDRWKIGLCRMCDNPVKPGYKFCEKHYQHLVEISALGNQSESMKKHREQIGKWLFKCGGENNYARNVAKRTQ